jgi:hypothetical protein
MTTSVKTFSARPNVRGRNELWVVSQNVATNQSVIGIQLFAEETAQQDTWHTSPGEPWSARTYSGLWTFDFRTSGLQKYTLLNTTFVATHNADGTLSVLCNWSISGDLLGTAASSQTLAVPRIPRGPRVKDAGAYKNSIAYVKDAGVYKIAIPYVKDAGVYKIGGS